MLAANTVLNERFIILYKTGSGSFSQVYICLDNKNADRLVAIKTEQYQENQKSTVIKIEAELLKAAQGVGIPRYIGKGLSTNFQVEFIISEALGPSLGDLLTYCGGKFTLKTTLMLFHQLIQRFEHLHSKKIVHCDLKPDNILMGIGKQSKIAYLIDFGISNFYVDRQGKHIELQTDCCLIGTVRYASLYSHQGFELTRRDDLIALGYLMYYLLDGSLPWQGEVDPNSERCRGVGQMKAEFKSSKQVKRGPKAFETYLDYCIALEYDEEPNYTLLLKLIEDLAREERIDLDDRCFDWNLIKASQILWSDPSDFDQKPNQIRSYSVPTKENCSVLLLNSTIMKLAQQQVFANQNEVRQFKQNLNNQYQNKQLCHVSENRGRKQKKQVKKVGKLNLFGIGKKSEQKSNSARHSVLSMAHSISLMSEEKSSEWNSESEEESKSVGKLLLSQKKRRGRARQQMGKRSARSLQKKHVPILSKLSQPILQLRHCNQSQQNQSQRDFMDSNSGSILLQSQGSLSDNSDQNFQNRINKMYRNSNSSLNDQIRCIQPKVRKHEAKSLKSEKIIQQNVRLINESNDRSSLFEIKPIYVQQKEEAQRQVAQALLEIKERRSKNMIRQEKLKVKLRKVTSKQNQMRMSNFLQNESESDSVHSDAGAIDEFEDKAEDQVMLPSLRRVKMQTNNIKDKKGKFTTINKDQDQVRK